MAATLRFFRNEGLLLCFEDTAVVLITLPWGVSGETRVLYTLLSDVTTQRAGFLWRDRDDCNATLPCGVYSMYFFQYPDILMTNGAWSCLSILLFGVV